MDNVMNWPIKRGWKCIICGNQAGGIDGNDLLSIGLHWGIVHATCYCDDCNTPYRILHWRCSEFLKMNKNIINGLFYTRQAP